MQDRVVIQEVLKNVAQAQQLETSAQREFKGQYLLILKLVSLEHKPLVSQRFTSLWILCYFLEAVPFEKSGGVGDQKTV